VYPGDTDSEAPGRPGDSINREVSAWLLEYAPLEAGVCRPVAYSGLICGGAAAGWTTSLVNGGNRLAASTMVNPGMSGFRSWSTRVRAEEAIGSGSGSGSGWGGCGGRRSWNVTLSLSRGSPFSLSESTLPGLSDFSTLSARPDRSDLSNFADLSLCGLSSLSALSDGPPRAPPCLSKDFVLDDFFKPFVLFTGECLTTTSSSSFAVSSSLSPISNAGFFDVFCRFSSAALPSASTPLILFRPLLPPLSRW